MITQFSFRVYSSLLILCCASATLNSTIARPETLSASGVPGARARAAWYRCGGYLTGAAAATLVSLAMFYSYMMVLH
jgi:hypothetical protein